MDKVKELFIKIKKFIKQKHIIRYFLIAVAVVLVTCLCLDFYVRKSTKDQIVKDYNRLSDIDCIVILGAKVRPDDNKPSYMLNDRLEKGIELYNNKVSKKIIMTGDHGTEAYDEVNIMKKFAIDKGVPSEDIFMDHAGFATYDSIYRAKEIFNAKKIVIISQEYHLYRALYIANKLGIKAYGVGADLRTYKKQTYRDIREIFARDKDLIKCIIKPKPTYLGEEISLDDSGDITNDKK